MHDTVLTMEIAPRPSAKVKFLRKLKFYCKIIWLVCILFKNIILLSTHFSKILP